MKNFFGAVAGILCAFLGAAASVFGGWTAALTTLLEIGRASCRERV